MFENKLSGAPLFIAAGVLTMLAIVFDLLGLYFNGLIDIKMNGIGIEYFINVLIYFILSLVMLKLWEIPYVRYIPVVIGITALIIAFAFPEIIWK